MAADKRPLSDLGVKMRDSLPPVLRGSHDYLAVIHAASRELDLLEAAIELMRGQFNPATADVLLSAYEAQYKLPVGGGGVSDDARRTKILARLVKITGSAEGREWEDTITALVGPGWSYREHDPADPTSPANGVIQVTLPIAVDDPAFEAARTQIREITAAHLELDLLSTLVFHLDSDPMDTTLFGA